MDMGYYSFKELFEPLKKYDLDNCAIVNNSVMKETGDKRDPYEPKTQAEIEKLVEHFENIIYMLRKTSTYKGHSLH